MIELQKVEAHTLYGQTDDGYYEACVVREAGEVLYKLDNETHRLLYGAILRDVDTIIKLLEILDDPSVVRISITAERASIMHEVDFSRNSKEEPHSNPKGE